VAVLQNTRRDSCEQGGDLLIEESCDRKKEGAGRAEEVGGKSGHERKESLKQGRGWKRKN